MRNVFRLVALLMLFAGAAAAQDNAGIYFYGPAPTVDSIGKLAAGASVTSRPDGAMTSVTVAWPEVTITLNMDPNWNREVQLSGIRGWLSEVAERDLKKPAVVLFLSNLDRTTTSLGSIIEPGYDRDGHAAAFLRKLVATTGGFLFTYQSFYSADGKRIVGLPGDPEELK
jgi:hypothetical protein